MSPATTQIPSFTIKDCAQRHYVLRNRDRLEERKAQQFVRENFLITRHLREYLTLMVGLALGDADRLDLE